MRQLTSTNTPPRLRFTVTPSVSNPLMWCSEPARCTSTRTGRQTTTRGNLRRSAPTPVRFLPWPRPCNADTASPRQRRLRPEYLERAVELDAHFPARIGRSRPPHPSPHDLGPEVWTRSQETDQISPMAKDSLVNLGQHTTPADVQRNPADWQLSEVRVAESVVRSLHLDRVRSRKPNEATPIARVDRLKRGTLGSGCVGGGHRHGGRRRLLRLCDASLGRRVRGHLIVRGCQRG